jgi:pimeloyl-ACP methyl ester carboxylesterase
MKLTVNGREAYAYTGGRPFDPALPCVVFSHGASHDHSVWTLLARWFAHHGHAVLAPDLPGHLRSAGPALDRVEALLLAAGATRAALVGHSMGSLIALEAAARMGEQATSLVMIGTAYPMAVSDALLTTGRERPFDAIRMVNNWSISGIASKPGYPSPGSWLHGGNLALMRRVQQHAQQAPGPATNVFLNDFETCNRYRGGLEAAANVRCPVHFVLGQADQMTPPRAARDIATALKARTHWVSSGHLQMGETPDQTLAALRAALISGDST